MIRMITRAAIFIKSRQSLSFVFVFFLVGCASQGVQQQQQDDDAAAVAIINQQEREEEAIKPFEAETLYDLLVAEVGGQRQRYDLALGNYLKQAHKTRDAGVAERAYQIAMFVGARQAALDASLLWVELQPENLDALHGSALELVYGGQLDNAFMQMEQQLSLGGDPAFDVLARAAGNSHFDEELGDLIRQFDELMQDYPDRQTLKLGKALLLQQSGDYASALSLSNQLLKQGRDFVPAMMVKGRALNKLERNAEAEKVLSDAVRRHPDKGRLRLLYARVLVHGGKLDLARDQFEVLLKQSPQDSDIVLSLALITLENDMEKEAESYFHRLLAIGDRNSTANYYLGRLSEKQKKYSVAKAHYLAVDSGNEFMAAQVAVSKMLVQQGKLDEALTQVGDARNRNPARMESLFLLEGELLVNDHQLNEALALFERALKTNPESVNLLYSRAMVHEKLDDLVGLENDLRAIIKVEPGNAAALNALGYTLADRTDRYEEAEALITRAYALNQKDPAILDSMGWIQFRLGNYEQAEKYLRMAYTEFPDAEIAAHLSEVLWMKGDLEAARALWVEALKKNPDSPILKETMGRLTEDLFDDQSETASTVK